MNLKQLIFIMTVSTQVSFAQKVEIVTSDIPHFWEAFDSLATSKDSVATIQKLYLDKASVGLKSFIRAKKFRASQYVKCFKAFPKFWRSIRPRTLEILNQREKIEDVLQKYKHEFPEFEIPMVCFAISPIQSGGTTGKGMILIGSEIACADSLTDLSEIKWLRSRVSTNSIVGLVAHEAVHTQQRVSFAYMRQFLTQRLLTQTIIEGAAEFVSRKLSSEQLNKQLYQYGNQNFDRLKKEFLREMKKNNWSRWLYNSPQKDRPKDLGYYIGYNICEGYFENAKDKKRALTDLLKAKNPGKIFKHSGFTESKTGF